MAGSDSWTDLFRIAPQFSRTVISFCPDDPNLILVTSAGKFGCFFPRSGHQLAADPRFRGRPQCHLLSLGDQPFLRSWCLRTEEVCRELEHPTSHPPLSRRPVRRTMYRANHRPAVGKTRPGARGARQTHIVDAKAVAGSLQDVVVTPGSTPILLSDNQGNHIDTQESFEPGQFEGISEAAELGESRVARARVHVRERASERCRRLD